MKVDYQPLDWARTRMWSDLDFVSPGKRFGDISFKYSGNEIPLGNVLIPAGVIINGSGPTVLLIGGVHGDEFEGPVAMVKLLHSIEPEQVQGRLIVLPALNAPAVNASSRVSPYDNVNLNRAFPGDPNGTPTQMIADFVENSIMPVCDAVIDLHAGGKASWFAPCSMAMKLDNDDELTAKNFQLAHAFGAQLIWVMGILNDDRSVNGAAFRQNIPSMAAELGGGGEVSPNTLKIGENGIRSILKELGVLPCANSVEISEPTYIEISDRRLQIASPRRGLFEPKFEPGDAVQEGECLGFVHDIEQISQRPTKVNFSSSGIAFVRAHRGLVERGDLLAIVGQRIDPDFR